MRKSLGRRRTPATLFTVQRAFRVFRGPFEGDRNRMNIYAGGLLWVGAAALVAAVAAYAIRRLGSAEGREQNNGPAGGVFSIVAGLNAVLVAFVLIALFDSVGAAGRSAYREADGLVAAAWASDSLPAATRDKVRDLSRAYMTTVIREEWPQMRVGG